MKILAAAAPLSLQAHPTEEQAAEGFAREEAAGIPIDAPHRIYRDPHAKPEILCALTRFEALCGFREPDEAARDIEALDVDALRPLVVHLAAGALESAVRWLLEQPDDVAATIVRDVARSSSLADWARRIAAAHPDDIGVVTALLLQRVDLEPGQAMYLDAGTLHAYLHGTGIELMTSSDNVVRGGLTTKHVDRTELLRVLDIKPRRPMVIDATSVDDAAVVWRVPTDSLHLARIAVLRPPHPLTAGPPAIVLALEGKAVIDGVALEQGEAALVEEPSVTVAGNGVVYVAAAGEPRTSEQRRRSEP